MSFRVSFFPLKSWSHDNECVGCFLSREETGKASSPVYATSKLNLGKFDS